MILRLVLTFGILVLSTNATAASSSWSNSLVQSFQSQCSTMGDITSIAMSQTDSLGTVIESMKADPSCTALRSSLTSVIGAQGNLAALMNTSQGDEKALDDLEAKMSQLLSAYDQEQDVNTKAMLASEISRTKIETLNYPPEQRARRRAQVYQSMAHLAQMIDTSLSALASNSACLDKREGAAVQLASQLAVVSSGLVSGGITPYLYVGGKSVDAFVNFIRDNRYNKLLKHAELIKAGPAIGCALEATSRTYCNARDTETLLRKSESFQNTSYEPKWLGFVLTSTHLIQMSDWISRLIAGAPATDKYASQRKSEGILLEASLKLEQDSMYAYLTEREREEKAANDPAQKANIRLALINDLIGAMGVTASGPVGVSSPFELVFAYDRQCGKYDFFRTGLLSRQTRPPVFSDCADLYLGQPVPDTTELRARVDLALSNARPIVGNRVALVKESDFSGVLQRFENGTTELASPHEATDDTLLYLREVKRAYGATIPGSVLQSIEELQTKLEQVQPIIDDPALSTQDKVAQLTILLAPDQNQNYIARKVEDIVRWDFQQKLRRGELNKNVDVIYRDSVIDSLNLNRRSGSFDLTSVLGDATTAKSTALLNIDLVYRTFSKQIVDYLRLLKLQSSIDASTARSRIETFCSQLISVPNIRSLLNSDEVANTCKGMVLKSVYSKSNAAVNFDELANRGQVDDRVCAVYDFRRKNRIFEINRNRRPMGATRESSTFYR